VTLSSQL